MNNPSFIQTYRACYKRHFPNHPHENRLLFTPWLLEAVEEYARQEVNEFAAEQEFLAQKEQLMIGLL